ncbi:hypothetical protein KR059_008563 [Drosophila kikkawai]|nr:hypothetical protein KR059_008563 [Drosophila kikkawai]
MNIRNNDPGAVQYGNFMNYYQFNSASERVKLLPGKDVWLPPVEEGRETPEYKPYYVLDVGCNSGVFTKLLHKHLEQLLQRPVTIIGVDIDERLIERALADNTNTLISYNCLDVLDETGFASITRHLNCLHCKKFDAVCCYSITMWIHLNHHDQGLQSFLKKLSDIAELLVVEPQPWKCYQTAVRRMKRAGDGFPLFPELKWRSDVELQIQNYLEQTLGLRKTFESTPTKWQRKICFYR